MTIAKREKLFLKHFCSLNRRDKLEILKTISPQQVTHFLNIFKSLKAYEQSKCLPVHIKKHLSMNVYKKKINFLSSKLNKKQRTRVEKNIKNISGGFWPVMLSAIVPLAVQLVYDNFIKKN